jgi:hypothetical protein
MSNDRQLIAAVDAKPAAAGFGLRAPNLFGPARDYLSNETQKAEIIAMMITRRPILKQAVFVMVLVMWVLALASLVWLYGVGRDNPTPTDLVVMIVLMVAPMMAALYLYLGAAQAAARSRPAAENPCRAAIGRRGRKARSVPPHDLSAGLPLRPNFHLLLPQRRGALP